MNTKIKMILLDAGHGGMIDNVYQTSGKRSPKWSDGSQYFEGVGNRLIRDELAKMLREEGIRYRYVNEGEKDTNLTERKNIANAICRKQGVENCLGISIHSNAFSSESANGYEAFTSKGQSFSDEVAEAWYEEFGKIFPELKARTDKSDSDRDKEDYLFMTNKTLCSWVLIESMFHTNEKECGILMSKQGRRKIALSLLNTIKRFV